MQELTFWEFLDGFLAVLGAPILIFGGLGFLCWYTDPKRPWMQRANRMRMYRRAVEREGRKLADEDYPDCAKGKPCTDDEYWEIYLRGEQP